MKYLVCEGLNDLTFLTKVVRNKLAKNPLPIKEMKKAQETFRYRNYTFLSGIYDLFIYKDKGRPYIYQKALPRLIIDSWKRLKTTIEFFLIIDKDFHPNPVELKKQLFNLLKNTLAGKKIDTDVKIISNLRLEIVSTSDSTFKTLVHIFLIPESLEEQMLEVSFQNHERELERVGLTRSTEMSIDEKLSRLCQFFGYEKPEELICCIVEEDWFIHYRWFNDLLQQLKDIII